MWNVIAARNHVVYIKLELGVGQLTTSTGSVSP